MELTKNIRDWSNNTENITTNFMDVMANSTPFNYLKFNN